MPSPPVQPASTVDEIKYIVFKSSLLELFKQCTSCHNDCIGEVAYQKGTFVAVKQLCSHCGHKRMWTSQPRIKDTPAGNILLSAAILFSGATPGKIITLLSHMRVACISDRTFYYHQSQYLYPAVLSVWEICNRSYWLSIEVKILHYVLVVMDELIALGTLLNMAPMALLNKVIHIELVQVSLN